MQGRIRFSEDGIKKIQFVLVEQYRIIEGSETISVVIAKILNACKWNPSIPTSWNEDTLQWNSSIPVPQNEDASMLGKNIIARILLP